MLKASLQKSFYASGLKFSCKRCSACCRYDSGLVYLSENDLEKLTLELKMNRNSFISAFCRWVTDWKGDEVLSLREKSNKDCILWESGCTVYQARPIQCITFPFWESIMHSSQTWEIAASGCPGMNNGEMHSEKTINDTIKLRDSQPFVSKLHGRAS